MKTRYFLFAALGVATALLLTSKSTKQLRKDLTNTALKNAKRWKSQLGRLSVDTEDKLDELRNMFKNRVEGLSDETRDRIKNILSTAVKNSKQLKRNITTQFG